MSDTSYWDMEDWARHIIKKFGRRRAKRFAKSETRCPCIAAGWRCSDNCKYSNPIVRPCEYRAHWLSLIYPSNFLLRNVKRSIMEKLKKKWEKIKNDL